PTHHLRPFHQARPPRVLVPSEGADLRAAVALAHPKQKPAVTEEARAAPYGWLVMMTVPAPAKKPAGPCAMLTFTAGSCAAASPRSCRTLSCKANTPSMPVCVYDSPPPLVLIGRSPPGAERPAAKNGPLSPGPTNPSASSPYIGVCA